jgi:hypothetical protein
LALAGCAKIASRVLRCVLLIERMVLLWSTIDKQPGFEHAAYCMGG